MEVPSYVWVIEGPDYKWLRELDKANPGKSKWKYAEDSLLTDFTYFYSKAQAQVALKLLKPAYPKWVFGFRLIRLKTFVSFEEA